MNDTHQLAPYRQAVWWTPEAGVQTLSGVVQIEANAPYVHWLDRLTGHLAAHNTPDGTAAPATGAGPQTIEQAAALDAVLARHVDRKTSLLSPVEHAVLMVGA